jgi:hypothetical protein
MSILSRALSSQLLSARPDHPNWLSVVIWWELRRVPYNIVLGLVGAVSLLATFFLIAASGVLEPGEDAIEPIAWIGLPLLGGMFFNACYTAGWAVELLIRCASPEAPASLGLVLFIGGTLLSLGVVLSPAVCWAVFDVVRWVWA